MTSRRRAMLDGITVVAVEQAVAAPFATRHLADLGARVLKVERPDGGDFARSYDTSVHGESSYFVWLNRGKESIVLDLKGAEGRAVLDTLIESADVFVQNLAPGVAERLGFGSAVLRHRHPRLITCAISGYGRGGPYEAKKAYDLLIQCETGLLDVTGTPGEAVKVGISVADIATGMYAYSAILCALFVRERTGEGTALDVSMIDALGEWMSQPVNMAVHGGSAPPRTGARHASIAPYGPCRTADGTIFLAVQNQREWRRMCEIVLAAPRLAEDARFATNPLRAANAAALQHLLDERFGTMSTEDALTLLDHAGIANARVRTPGEFATHPQLAARDRWRQVQTAVGPVTALLPPVEAEGYDVVMGAVPALGQHTVDVRRQLSC